MAVVVGQHASCADETYIANRNNGPVTVSAIYGFFFFFFLGEAMYGFHSDQIMPKYIYEDI